ncbi:hypothetical protein AA958_01855 [Streptomyces sp. CNQ-509]|uniref:hypothetical protein n=1 Tax=unclassified Streptomyces TaxID=2593676 RepID=UPI00062DF0C9|nr:MULTISPECIES: hypothetical protein [unclassified Streptomyces]AKH81120.1 hypothetical protein AA958_01855 [Streptomyces sp. CNQ-509]AZM44719.1 hypothetical protein DMB38_01845 [Streptomyces sp. WAC 06738]
MATETDTSAVVSELAEIRRSLDVGLARIDGRLALLSQRSQQMEREIDELTARVTSLEHSRWPLPSIAALTGAGAMALALWQALGR